MKVKHVLFLASYYPNRIRSVGPFMRRHAESISLYSKVSVLTSEPDFSLKNKPHEIETCIENNIEVVRVYYNPNAGNIPILKSLIRFTRFLSGLYKGLKIIKRKSRPDIIHLNVINPLGIFAALLKIKTGIPLLITEHSSLFINENFEKIPLLIKFFHRVIFKFADQVTVVSKIQGETLIKYNLIKKYEIVPNVINDKVFNPPQSKPQKSKIELLHVSNLQHWKGLENIIGAVSEVSKIRTDFFLKVIGGGQNKTYYENIAQKLNLLNTFVYFEGEKKEKDVADAMREADFFIINSDSESFCCVLVESLACGLPVIAPALGAIPENLNKERGILTSDRSVEALVSAILEMLANYKTFNNSKIFPEIAENFSLETIGKKFMNIYNSIKT